MDIALQFKISQLFFNSVSLSVCDPLLYVINRYTWRCSEEKLRDHYRANIGMNHLEIGPGTGKMLDTLNLPTTGIRLSLLDLGLSCLRRSKRRLERYHPNIYQCNILEPINHISERFDSICVNHLMHRIPQGFHTKGIIFYHLKRLLKTDGVLFGSTVVSKGANQNLLSFCINWLFNMIGLYNNHDDSVIELERALKTYYRDVSIKVGGSTVLFSARPR